MPQDVFYITLTIALVVFMGLFTWMAIVWVKTLHVIRRVVEGIEETAQNLSVVKEGLKVGFLTFLGKLMGDHKD
jgi:hypothetical protein